MSDGKRAASAPWIRTRLRTAPGAAVALAVLVLVTAFLAAAFPRAVDAYETKGLRHDIRRADAGRSALEIARPQPGLELPQAQREAGVRTPELKRVGGALVKALPAPLRADTSSVAYGLRTTKPVLATEPWLPRPDTVPPQLSYTAQTGLKDHARLVEGAWPTTPDAVTAASRAVRGAVTEETAAALNMKVGSTLELPTAAGGSLKVTITGIVAPRDPRGSYWSADPLVRTPSLIPDPTSRFPQNYWTGTVLLAEDAGPALLATATEPAVFWRIPPDPSALTGPDGDRLTSVIASLESGPGLLKVRAIAGDTAAVLTGLGHIVKDNARMRDAISPVIAVAALGIGSVAAVVLVMTGALIAARRKAELALMRSRGGSLRGIGGRLLAETSVTVVPASALGLLLAVLAVGEGRWWPAALAAAGVGLLVCVALPLRTTLQHIRPTLHGAREDMVSAKPSRRRTVAELTLLVLAVGAVTALRRRGTSGGGTDVLVSGAPVLVALIAALVLVRLYPLPLRLAARPIGPAARGDRLPLAGPGRPFLGRRGPAAAGPAAGAGHGGVRRLGDRRDRGRAGRRGADGRRRGRPGQRQERAGHAARRAGPYGARPGRGTERGPAADRVRRDHAGDRGRCRRCGRQRYGRQGHGCGFGRGHRWRRRGRGERGEGHDHGGRRPGLVHPAGPDDRTAGLPERPAEGHRPVGAAAQGGAVRP
ncbi:putative ABC transport system permease protein [Streptomyces sp. Termitarium-T10T-6]|nr:putative ABC transport system permease protein [Streptomyces sp. Termitarium-T10T-6]